MIRLRALGRMTSDNHPGMYTTTGCACAYHQIKYKAHHRDISSMDPPRKIEKLFRRMAHDPHGGFLKTLVWLTWDRPTCWIDDLMSRAVVMDADRFLRYYPSAKALLDSPARRAYQAYQAAIGKS